MTDIETLTDEDRERVNRWAEAVPSGTIAKMRIIIEQLTAALAEAREEAERLQAALLTKPQRGKSVAPIAAQLTAALAEARAEVERVYELRQEAGRVIVQQQAKLAAANTLLGRARDTLAKLGVEWVDPPALLIRDIGAHLSGQPAAPEAVPLSEWQQQQAQLAAANTLLHEFDAAAELMPEPDQLRTDKRICLDAKRILAGLIEERRTHLSGQPAAPTEPPQCRDCGGLLSVIPDGFGEAYTCKRCDERGQPAAPDPCKERHHDGYLQRGLECPGCPAEPDPRDAEIARLEGDRADLRHEVERLQERETRLLAQVDAMSIDAVALQKARAEVARLKEALAAAEREREDDERDMIGQVNRAEARVRELEAELAQLKGRVAKATQRLVYDEELLPETRIERALEALCDGK